MRFLLLAQREQWKSMGRKFSGSDANFSRSDFLWLLAMVVAAGVGIWLLNRLARRDVRPKSLNNPSRLFRELAEAHGLNREERGLLNKLTQALKLRHPVQVFLKPKSFEGLPSELSAESEKLALLAGKLFSRQPPSTT